MKAIKYTKYGTPEVLQIVEINKPTPKPNEILIKINASTVTKVDSIFREGKEFFARMATGITKPKESISILGTEFSGIVEEIGSDVKLFKKGDFVFGAGHNGQGTHAEYITMPEDGPIIIKPNSIDDNSAAAIPSGALTALPFLRDNGKIQKGNKVLIIGASGSVGTYAVQFAKYFGAEVTGLCSSSNTEMVKSLGADYVIDYTKEDFTKSSSKYDIIFDTVGKSSFKVCKDSLTENGIYLSTFVSFRILTNMLFTSKFGKKKAIIAFTGLRSVNDKLKDLLFIKDMLEKGTLKVIIDKVYPYTKIAEAHNYVDQGHKKGNVVITF
ncbi:MAG: NAD(P)-dependent alcohol dehydrogenase [Ignavibacteriae bacterium]|nr:NAD(P)-dependent alcohol dehydrogenase [Ignavibacteriota bacterium]